MLLTFDIEKSVDSLLKKIEDSADNEKIHQDLNDFILMTQGFHNHVNELDKPQAQKLLTKTKEVINQFEQRVSLQHKKEEEQGFNDLLKYALKVLFRLESLLQVQVTKNQPTASTPQYIKSGIAKLSQESIAKIVPKE